VPLDPTIPVFYCDEMVADTPSFSPSAGKPRAAVRDWLQHQLPIEVRRPVAASRAQLELAHDPSYVEGVLSGRILNGFDNADPAVNATLPWTTGALLSAALCAIGPAGDSRRPQRVACAPVSGFHHAGYSGGYGYCTFNGLVIVAIQLKRLGLVNRVHIVDYDQHYGDGTWDIIRQLGLDWIDHTSHHSDRLLTRGRALMEVRGPVRKSDYSLILYQAGADMHIDDPLGGSLTTEQLYERDLGTFQGARMYRMPIVWCLAGGYQRDAAGTIAPVLEIHRNTMRACAEVFV